MLATSTIQRESEVASWNAQVFLSACAFMAGLLCAFNIPVVGSFPAAEGIFALVLVVGILVLVLTKRIASPLLTSPWFWAFLVAEFLTLAGYVVSDFYRSSAPNDIARGWSRIVFLSIDTTAVALLFGEGTKNFRLLMIGASISGFIVLAVTPAQYGDVWKFGVAWPVTTLAIMGGAYFGVWPTLAALLGLFAINYVRDFRSLGGICLAIAGLLFIQAFDVRQRKLIFGILAVVGVMGLTVLKMNSKTVDTSERGARSDVERSSMLTVAGQAFWESPWIGQGSWFSNSNVMTKFLDLRAAAAEEAGVHGYSADEEDEKMAIHSQLLVSLAEGGIPGGTFFVFYGVMVLWALWYCTFERELDQLSGVYLLILIGAVWNLLMSPFSGGHRINIAVAVGVVLLLLQEKRAARVEEVEHLPSS